MCAHLLLSPTEGGVVEVEQQAEDDARPVEYEPGQQQASPPPEQSSRVWFVWLVCKLQLFSHNFQGPCTIGPQIHIPH
jgi:hypothetical protein